MTRRKDGLWQQQMTVTINGHKKQKCFYGKTKQEVLKKIAAFEEEQERGVTFEKVAAEWWREHEPTIAFTTAISYKPAKERAVAEFGKTYIKYIKPSDINRFLIRFVEEKHAAQKTAKTQLLVLNQIYKYAVSNGYSDINAARDLSVPRGLKHSERMEPSSEDIARIKASVHCTFGLFAYMALYTGCRRGELIALTWDDIDLDKRIITINKSIYIKNNQPILKQPKTKAGIRELPILNKLFEQLIPGTGLVFPSPEDKMLTEAYFQSLWKKYVVESGVTCTPHQLRHAYATMLFENNIGVKDAQELLGHAQAATTQEIYTHLREKRKAETREKLRALDIN